MAREEIRIDITTEDDASRVLEDVAEQADRVDAADPNVEVTADTSSAQADLTDLGAKADRAAADVAKVGDSSDQSRSVLANLVGNSAQDLGELGGVAGTAGVAIGQLAEYATDGNISLRGLVATAGPMLAIGVAVSFITKHMAEAKQEAEELKKLNAELAESLRAGDVEAAAEKMADGYGDLIDQAEAAGVSVQDLTRFLTTQDMTLQELLATGTATGDEMVALALNVTQAKDSFADQSGALATNVARQQEIQEALGGTAGAASDGAAATRDLTAAYDELTGRLSDDAAYLDVQDSFDDVEQAAREAFAAAAAGEGDAEQAARDHQRAVIDLKQQVADYSATVAEIPPQQATEILAMIDRGQFAAAEAALAQLERNRVAHLRLEVAYPNRPVGYPPNAPWPPTGAAASSTVVNVTMPRGMRGRDVAAALEGYSRRNGGRLARR